MAIKYFYIDDDVQSVIQETAKGLSIRPDDLIVEPYQHKTWGKQLEFIIAHQDEIDGILFDWGLVEKNEDGDLADFNVEALAQQIRRITIGDDRLLKKDFPIVLCSAQDKFIEIFSKELTGHDLFDAIYEKSAFIKPKNLISELVNLANGYKGIENSESAIDMLNIESIEDTDFRIIDRLDSFIRDDSPIHEIARFILTRIINVTGVLIDTKTLAARLGIDVIDKYEDKSWKKLLAILKEYSYSGVFSDAYWQYWANKIELWIEENNLSDKSPKEKVAHLNKEFELKLNPAIKTEKSKSDDFWVVCKKTQRPIALEDAILAQMKDKEFSKVPWQEDEYYSIDTALEIGINLIHPSEKERVQRLKKIYPQKRPNKK